MADAPFTSDQLAALEKYDTPTICNALEAIVPERRTTGFTTAHLVCADPSLKPIFTFGKERKRERTTATTKSHRGDYISSCR